jgi:hypothetical protein
MQDLKTTAQRVQDADAVPWGFLKEAVKVLRYAIGCLAQEVVMW